MPSCRITDKMVCVDSNAWGRGTAAFQAASYVGGGEGWISGYVMEERGECIYSVHGTLLSLKIIFVCVYPRAHLFQLSEVFPRNAARETHREGQ